MYRYVIESRSPITLRDESDQMPAPPTPPAPPAPPVILPPERPFIWPPEITHGSEPSDRTKKTWLISGRADDDPDGKIYALLSQAGRPDAAHHNAGIIQAGPLTGFRAWAPVSAPSEMLWAIIEGRL